jgi:TonB family protein
MRLDPTHKPIVGVNAASLVSVPVLIILFVLSMRSAPPSVSDATQPRVESRPAATPSAPASVPASNPSSKPPESVRTVEHRQQPAVEPKKPTVGRVIYSFRWSGVEVRRKIAGEIPQYPAGVTVEALARLELVVTAAGGVRSAKILQAGNAQCDEAALREVRQWKFEPLVHSRGRADQRCVVLLSFMRK